MNIILSILLTVLTTYHRGVYESVDEVELRCSVTEANAVMDQLMHDFEYDPHHIWAWAFWGTGEQKDDRKQGFVIHYDTVRYDRTAELLRIDMSLISPRGTVNQLHVEPTLSDKQQDGTRAIFFSVDNFKNLIKHVDATLTLMPTDDPNVQRLTVVTHCRFGWFFNLFISHKMYRNTVDWRIEQFLQNLRCTAEHKPLSPVKVELVQ